jgi:hypothetical protein
LIATASLKALALERQIPHRLKACAERNARPERSVERAVVVMKSDDPGVTRTATFDVGHLF